MLQGSSRRTRLVDRVATLCARPQDPLALLERVARLVREEVPYACAGWILVDPDTLLMNGVYAEDVDREVHLELIAAELGEEDVNKFWELARRGISAASLSAATDGTLGRSRRWARVYQPRGLGDELRAVLTSSGLAWGHACLTRLADQPFFDPEEVALVAAVAPLVGEGIRTCYLAEGHDGFRPDGADARALVMLADDGSVESASPQALEWLGPPADASLQSAIVLHEVAHRARALADGRSPGPPALARARSRSGGWLVVRGIRVAPDRTALVLEPAHGADLAPVLLGLHQLTEREREVTRLLLHGMSTAQIAQDLWISPETLRGHVKAVFAKLGVSSRPELAALLSHEPRFRARPGEPAAPRSP